MSEASRKGIRVWQDFWGWIPHGCPGSDRLDDSRFWAFQSEEPLNRQFPTADEMAGLLTCLRAATIAKLTVYRAFQAMSQAVDPGEGKNRQTERLMQLSSRCMTIPF
ncbi:hypothetical protein TWF132_002342 [Orbilia oligospora]|nr:hypothetical protein TWF128_006505 [Orbilia oligospora]KAF3295012.1 hypothetical protein TWF132_002342 [Orbilia oligospora]